MEKLKNCPCCGRETILCQMQTEYVPFTGSYMEFSILCLGCGMEFKVRRNSADNMAQYIYDPAKAAREVIELFNRREGEQDGQ